MFGTGGSALVSKTMGEGNKERANRDFSLFVYFSAVTGILIAIIGIIFIGPIAAMLGAEGTMLTDSVTYGRVILMALPTYILQMEFQSFFVTAEKPQLGLAVTLISGLTNMVLDALFVAVFNFGLTGAAAATALSQAVGGIISFLYFLRPNTSILRLTKTGFNGRSLLKACTNGSSEFMSNVSISLVSMLYNIQLLKYAGENGVAAYGVLMYVSMIFSAAFIGYSIGTAPVIGFNYGAGNDKELKGLLRKSIHIILIFSVCMLIFAECLAMPLSKLFVGYDAELMSLTCRGFRIYSFAFLFMGFAIFSSGFFTALNDGLTSAVISFLRTLVFQVIAVILIPLVLDIDGIWLSIVIAEMMAVVVSAVFLAVKQKKFHY